MRTGVVLLKNHGVMGLKESDVNVPRTITSSVQPFLWIPPPPLYITDAPPYMSHCCTLVTSKSSLFARHAYAPPSENLSQNRDSSVNNTLFLSLIVYLRCAVTQFKHARAWSAVRIISLKECLARKHALWRRFRIVCVKTRMPEIAWNCSVHWGADIKRFLPDVTTI